MRSPESGTRVRGIVTIALLFLVSGALACSRWGSGRQVPVLAPMDTLVGVAMLPAVVDPFLGAELHVRLVDLQSTDTTRILLASTTQHLSGKSPDAVWFLGVPARVSQEQREGALLILSVEDRTGIRYLGSGRVRDSKAAYRPPGAPASLQRLGVRLSSLPPG